MRGEECFVVGDGVQPDVDCNVDSGIAEVGTRKVGIGHGAAFYDGTAKVCITEVGTIKVAESYVGVGEVGTFKVGIAQVQLVAESRAEVVGAALLLPKSGDCFSLHVPDYDRLFLHIFFIL